MALTFRDDFANFCQKSKDIVLNIIYGIHTLFGKDEYAKGKLMWLKLFPNLYPVDDMINCYGSEDEYFYIKTRHFTKTAFSSECSNPYCTMPVSIQGGTIVSYSQREQCTTAKTISDAVSHWFENNQSKKCTKATCAGVRKYTARHFINGFPPILPIEISNCPWILTDDLQLGGISYILYGGYIQQGSTFYKPHQGPSRLDIV